MDNSPSFPEFLTFYLNLYYPSILNSSVNCLLYINVCIKYFNLGGLMVKYELQLGDKLKLGMMADR